MSEQFRFSKGFLWGAATAAYQIEGYPLADGAGPSIWHRFSHTPGRTLNGDTGDIACDHYHRYESDVALMRELGLKTYRMSIAWSRIFPEGKGRVNQAGIDFYSRLIDRILEAGIVPNVTLYHWDLPAALDDLGGWLNPEIANWFGDYASTMFDALADRVPMWATLNEPLVIADGGYMNGNLAPGHRNLFEVPIVSHNLLRAHGMGVQAFRARNAADSRIGIVINMEPKYAATDSQEDLAATARADAYANKHYLDPLFLGAYPHEFPDMFGIAWIDHPHEDFKLIQQPIDFLGVNYYSRGVVKHDDASLPFRFSHVKQEGLHTEMGWEVFPDGLRKILVWIKERYGDRPMYVTENGSAFADPPEAIDGKVDDPLRTEYLKQHLRAIRSAMMQGVDVRGYYAWSLMDNYEWSYGYSKRFGIVHVNYRTLERTVKATGKHYSSIIASNGASLE